MSDLIITIRRDEKQWPGWSARTRITGYHAGVHSMSQAAWADRVVHVGADKIQAAIDRGDVIIAGEPGDDTRELSRMEAVDESL